MSMSEIDIKDEECFRFETDIRGVTKVWLEIQCILMLIMPRKGIFNTTEAKIQKKGGLNLS